MTPEERIARLEADVSILSEAVCWLCLDRPEKVSREVYEWVKDRSEQCQLPHHD